MIRPFLGLSVKCWGVHPTSLLWHQSYVWLVPFFLALCQMLGYSPYESSLAPIIVMVGAILFAQK